MVDTTEIGRGIYDAKKQKVVENSHSSPIKKNYNLRSYIEQHGNRRQHNHNGIETEKVSMRNNFT